MISLTVIATLLALGWLIRTLWRAIAQALAPQIPARVEDLAH
jgi:Flp pilus assembly pilin Flp